MDYDIERAAVVALHMQNDIVGADGPFAPFFAEQVAERDVIERTATLLEAARVGGLPVVYVRVCWPEGHEGLVVNNGLMGAVKESGALIDGSPGAAIIDALAPHPDDAVVPHQAMNPFVAGDLEAVLRERGIDTLLLAGVATNVIVEDVARVAGSLGLYPVVVADCCAAASTEAHDASIETLGLLATAVVDLATATDQLRSHAADVA